MTVAGLSSAPLLGGDLNLFRSPPGGGMGDGDDDDEQDILDALLRVVGKAGSGVGKATVRMGRATGRMAGRAADKAAGAVRKAGDAALQRWRARRIDPPRERERRRREDR
uniref:Uncharacterized protein n=1 Tax=Odontella aurita TaxID=265563 RepID=A0A7S4JQP7_9STRA